MSQAVMISFRKEVSLVEAPGKKSAIHYWKDEWTLDQITPGLLAAFRRLSSGGATQDELREIVRGLDYPGDLHQLESSLEQCSKLNLLCYTLAKGSEILVTVVPMVRGFQFDSSLVTAGARYRLSRFAYFHEQESSLVLESPLCTARMVLPGHTGARLIAELTQPHAYPDLCDIFDGLGEDTAHAFLSILANAALVTFVDDNGTSAEDADRALAQWEFHDLLFHSRCRSGRHDYTVGGVYPFLGRIAPLPAVKPQRRVSTEILPLHAPDVERLKLEDRSLTSILESRKSIRAYSALSITAEQIGEFLYRTARVRNISGADPSRSRYYEISSRPYPSGGAAYDLEVYLTVNRCDKIPSGIYHYDPLKHQLHKLTAYNTQVEELLRNAQFTASMSFRPQTVITLTSRFQRLSWKYRGLAYATTLKNVGVLYQTMYLVATAMGLAPCALGNGNSSLFADATGTNYFVESAVGDFVLGGIPNDSAKQ